MKRILISNFFERDYMPRRITKNGMFPNTTKHLDKYLTNPVYLDEFGHQYDLAPANAMIKKGFPIGRYVWTKRGYELEKQFN